MTKINKGEYQLDIERIDKQLDRIKEAIFILAEHIHIEDEGWYYVRETIYEIFSPKIKKLKEKK